MVGSLLVSLVDLPTSKRFTGVGASRVSKNKLVSTLLGPLRLICFTRKCPVVLVGVTLKRKVGVPPSDVPL